MSWDNRLGSVRESDAKIHARNLLSPFMFHVLFFFCYQCSAHAPKSTSFRNSGLWPKMSCFPPNIYAFACFALMLFSLQCHFSISHKRNEGHMESWLFPPKHERNVDVVLFNTFPLALPSLEIKILILGGPRIVPSKVMVATSNCCSTLGASRLFHGHATLSNDVLSNFNREKMILTIELHHIE